jgi:hypothetical protein
MIIGCGKSTTTPTAPTASTPPIATPAPAPEPAPTPPPAIPPPSSNAAGFSTLNAPGTVVGTNDTASSERTTAFDRQVYDDFVIASGATIRTIAWQGKRAAGATPTFYVAIMPDGGDNFPVRQYVNDRPVALWSASYTGAEVEERFETSSTCEGKPQEQCGYYDYAAVVAIPFVAKPGTKYWLMIQSDFTNAQGAGFKWRKGTGDNGFSTGNLAGTTAPWDMAFALKP